jgi:single-strand DNA-binding protein
MMNRIVLVGRMTNDPDERHANSGTVLGRFRMAVDRNRRGPDGEKETDFFNVVCFGKTAEFVNRYLGRGDLVGVDGRLQMRDYTDREGNPRTWVEVAADSVQGLSSRSESSRGGGGGGGGSSRRDDFDDDGGKWDHTDDAPADDKGGDERPARRTARGRPGAGAARGDDDDRPRSGGDDDRPPPGGRKTQEFAEPEGGAFADDNDDPFAEE